MPVPSIARPPGLDAIARGRVVGSTPPALSPLQRNLLADTGVAVGVGISTALVITLLPTIARRGGLDPLGLAFLAAAPFAANVLAIFAGRVGPHSPRGLAVLRGLGGLLLGVLLVASAPPILALVALGFWMTIGFGSPLQTRLWGQMYPAPRRGRLVGIVGTGRAAAAGVGVLAGGFLADRIGGLEVVAIGGLVALACGLAALGFRTPGTDRPAVFSVRASLHALASRPKLRRTVTAQGFVGGGLIAAAPLFALVQVDRLSLSLAEVGSLGILTATSTTISYLGWGLLLDRRGARVTMVLGSLFGTLGLLVYALAPSLAVLWIAAIALGLCNAAIEIGIQGVLGEECPLEERSAAQGGWNAVTGLRGMAAPFLATSLVASGLVDVTGGLLIAGATSAFGLLLYFRPAHGPATDEEGLAVRHRLGRLARPRFLRAAPWA